MKNVVQRGDMINLEDLQQSIIHAINNMDSMIRLQMRLQAGSKMLGAKGSPF